MKCGICKAAGSDNAYTARCPVFVQKINRHIPVVWFTVHMEDVGCRVRSSDAELQGVNHPWALSLRFVSSLGQGIEWALFPVRDAAGLEVLRIAGSIPRTRTKRRGSPTRASCVEAVDSSRIESDVTTRAGWGGVEPCFGWLKLEQRTGARGLPRRARFKTQNEGREETVSHEIFLRPEYRRERASASREVQDPERGQGEEGLPRGLPAPRHFDIDRIGVQFSGRNLVEASSGLNLETLFGVGDYGLIGIQANAASNYVLGD
ncbi:hypothetical protein B0H14DRAFT_3132531 [Mycena olivaceomarginata]|nr:hypothetical protein B0H14DRAFT_3132531 [Mycena olivaceomarginata]